MNTRKMITPAAALLCCLVLVSVALARASMAYELNWSVLASGGAPMQSARYATNGTLGQPSTVGRSASVNYRLGAGYWHGVFMPAPTPGPALSIASHIPAYMGRPVDVPITFASNGHEIAAVVFSVDFDEHCLAFDPTDGNGDGIPDAVSFDLPAAFAPAVLFDADDTDGELDITILDLVPPLASLPDDVLATITFTPACAPDPGQVIVARVGFSDDPAASFGNTAGQSVPGTTSDGSVEIRSFRPGDCNGDDIVDAGDLTALVLEIFDGDGSDPANTPGGTFSGCVGCDANEDGVVDAGDISCTVLIIFYGPGACDGGMDLSGVNAPPLPSDSTASFQGPGLTIPTQVPAVPGGRVTVPIHFTSNGHDISSVVFSVDYDQTWLAYSSTAFNLPGNFVAHVAHDAADTDGELDFVIADFFAPLAAVPDGVVASITFDAGSPAEATDAFVGFSQDPAASFGSTTGQSVAGTTEDGSVRIAGVRMYLPLVMHHHMP